MMIREYIEKRIAELKVKKRLRGNLVKDGLYLEYSSALKELESLLTHLPAPSKNLDEMAETAIKDSLERIELGSGYDDAFNKIAVGIAFDYFIKGYKAKEMNLSSKGFSEGDMIGLAEWIKKNRWVGLGKFWCPIREYNWKIKNSLKTTSELLAQYLEERG